MNKARDTEILALEAEIRQIRINAWNEEERCLKRIRKLLHLPEPQPNLEPVVDSLVDMGGGLG